MRYLPSKVKKYGVNRTLHPLVPPCGDRRCFIYFLIKGKKIIYIGQTKNIRSRVHYHNCMNSYERIRFIECKPEEATFYERRWIRRFNPSQNMMMYDGTVGRRYSLGFDRLKYKTKNRRLNFNRRGEEKFKVCSGRY